jgi:hypothetical protein
LFDELNLAQLHEQSNVYAVDDDDEFAAVKDEISKIE